MGPGSSLCEWKKPARTDNATGPVRESIGGTRLFHAPDLVPDLGAVRLLQKQTADDKGHAQRQQSSKDAVAYLCALHLLGWPRVLLLNCALDERFVESRRAGSLRPVARLERVLRVQNVKMVPPSDPGSRQVRDGTPLDNGNARVGPDTGLVSQSDCLKA